MDKQLIPEALILSESVSLENIRSEVVRLGSALNRYVRDQPLACFTDADGVQRPGWMAGANPEIKVRFDSRVWSCSGSYTGGNDININVGQAAVWADIVEVMVHELCHRLRPIEEQHTPAFWQLLDLSLQSAYGVRLGPKPPKGQKQYFRDWVAAERIQKAHPLWASARPLMPAFQKKIFHYEKFH